MGAQGKAVSQKRTSKSIQAAVNKYISFEVEAFLKGVQVSMTVEKSGGSHSVQRKYSL